MKISCEVIKDLMPLCYEDIASDESKLMVSEHCKECESCSEAYKRMREGEIKIEDNGSGLKQFMKACKENSNAVLALCCYSILVIVGIIHGIIAVNTQVDGATGLIVLYDFFFYPLAGGFASAAIARHKLGLKYVFPIICGVVTVSYQNIILARYYESFIFDIGLFMWGFVPAIIGFVVGMIRGKRLGVSKGGMVNEGMVAGVIVAIVAVLLVFYLPSTWLLCAIVGGAGVAVFVVSLMLRVKARKRKEMVKGK